MIRLERRNRKDIVFKNCGSIIDVFDDSIKDLWRINDKEYDYISEFGDDELLGLLVDNLDTFSKKRKAITLINNILKKYNYENSNKFRK